MEESTRLQLNSLNYQLLRVDPNFELNHDGLFKVIIIGDSGVGKSCIVQRLTQNIFKNDHQITIGVEFGAFVLKIENKIIKLQIWDTAGQEQFRSITKLFYKNSQAAVLVYDVTKRESFENVMSWLNEIEENRDQDMLVYLVGNRIDLSENRQVPTSEGQQCAKEKGFNNFFETSARTGENVQEVFETLGKHLYIVNKTKLDQFKEKDETDMSGQYRSQSIALNQPKQVQKKKKKCCGGGGK